MSEAGGGWWDWELYPPSYNYCPSRLFQSLVSLLVTSLTIARILLLQSQHTRARAILAKVYPYASEDDVEARYQSMATCVRESVMLTQTTNWWHRTQSLMHGANRRALSE